MIDFNCRFCQQTMSCAPERGGKMECCPSCERMQAAPRATTNTAAGEAVRPGDTQTATATATPEVVPIDSEAAYAVQFETDGEVRTLSGTAKSVNARLREAVVAGVAHGDVTATIQTKDAQGQWMQSEAAIRSLPGLDPVYRPARCLFVKSIWVGALLGFSLEALHQSWLLYQHYQGIGPVVLMWLPVALFLGIVLDDAMNLPFGKYLFPGLIVVIGMGKFSQMMQGFDQLGEVLAPTFAALVISAATGATLGISLVGGLTCLWLGQHGHSLKAAPDAAKESLSGFRMLAVALTIAFIGFALTYAKWTRHWPVHVETSLRETIKEEGVVR